MSCPSPPRPRPVPLAVAWNHLQIQLVERLGLEGLSLARQLAMTTYRSETDFDDRFGRSREPDGQLSIVSYLEHQGDKLIDRFDPATYRTLAGAMDRHDIGEGRGGLHEALARLAAGGSRLTGIGIQDDILYGPHQVRATVDAAAAAGVPAGLPRDPLHEGPRRVPRRVGSAHRPAARGAHTGELTLRDEIGVFG